MFLYCHRIQRPPPPQCLCLRWFSHLLSHYSTSVYIHTCLFCTYVWLPLWSSGQSSWLQNQRSGFDSWHYHILWVVGLKRDPLSLVSTTDELLGWKRSASGLENREYGHRDLSCWLCSALHLQKLALASPTSGGCSVSIVRSWTRAMKVVVVCLCTYTCIYVCFCHSVYVAVKGV
jgi:hypothetical protein